MMIGQLVISVTVTVDSEVQTPEAGKSRSCLLQSVTVTLLVTRATIYMKFVEKNVRKNVITIRKQVNFYCSLEKDNKTKDTLQNRGTTLEALFIELFPLVKRKRRTNIL